MMITVIIVVIIVSPIRGRNVTRQGPGLGVTTEPLATGTGVTDKLELWK